MIKRTDNNVKMEVSLPLTTGQVLQFISFLHLWNFAASSITTYITAICFVHKMGDFHDPTAVFSVQKVLSAGKTVDFQLLFSF